MNRTAEREKKYTWVGPIILGHLALYKHPSSLLEIKSVSDIGQNIVIGKLDGLALNSLRSEIDVNALHTSSDEQSADLLYHRRGDLWVTGDIDGPMAIKRLGLPMPDLVFKRGVTDLSLGCSLKMETPTLARLKAAHDSMADFRKEVIGRYLTPDNGS